MSDASFSAQAPESHPTEASMEAPANGLSLLATAATAALVSLVVVTSALLVYDRVLRKPVQLAAVNVSQLIEAHELLFSDLVTNPDATDSDRARAMKLAEELGPKLTDALEETRRDCGCQLLVSSAIVGTPQLDLTSAVGSRIGLNPAEIKAASARVRANLTAQRQARASATPADRPESPSPLALRQPRP